MMDQQSLTRNQRKKANRRRLRAEFEASLDPGTVPPQVEMKLAKKPRQLERKAVVLDRRDMDLHKEKVSLLSEGKVEEAAEKREEAMKVRAEALRKAELSQEIASSNALSKGKEPPSQVSPREIITRKRYR